MYIAVTPINASTTYGVLVGTVPDGSIPGTFMVQPTNAAVPAVTVSLANASQPTLRTLDGETTLAYAGSTTVSGSIASVRGNTTIAAATTIAGSSYIYGTQGKITVKGTMSGGAEVSAGIVGQLDLSAALGVTAPMAAIWGDMGASTGTVTGANLDIAVLYNTTATTVNSHMRTYGKASVVLDISSNGSACLDASSTAAGSVIGHILVKINGVAGVLRVYQTS